MHGSALARCSGGRSVFCLQLPMTGQRRDRWIERLSSGHAHLCQQPSGFPKHSTGNQGCHRCRFHLCAFIHLFGLHFSKFI
jgi:hypothetical protein